MTSVTRSAAMAMPVAMHKRMGSLSLAQTPGGSIYGTTPGGTRVMYSLRDLLRLSQSPMSRTLPTNLPLLPGITVEDGAAGSHSSSPVSIQSPLSSSPGANDSGLGNPEVRITSPARAGSVGGMASGGDGHRLNWPGSVIQRQRSSNSYSQGDLPVKSRVISGGGGDAHGNNQQVDYKINNNGVAANKSVLSNNNKQNIGRSHELPANWRDHPDMWARGPNKSAAKKPPTQSAVAAALNADPAVVKDQTSGPAKKKRHHHKKHASSAAVVADGDSPQQANLQQQQRSQAAAAARGARRRRTVSETQVEERKKSDGAMEGFAKKLTSQNTNNNAKVVQQQRNTAVAAKQQQQQQPKTNRIRSSGKVLRTEDSVAEENENDADAEQQFELDV